MLSGLKDELVPPSHMHALTRIARAYRKDASVNIESIAESASPANNGGQVDELVKDDAGVRFIGLKEGKHNDTCIQPVSPKSLMRLMGIFWLLYTLYIFIGFGGKHICDCPFTMRF